METGYSYFGARYYNSDISVWLSVDPIADKYPSLSAYCYVFNNPLKYIDPFGLEPEDFGDGLKSFIRKTVNFFQGNGWFDSHEWFCERNSDGTLSDSPKIFKLRPYIVCSSDSNNKDGRKTKKNVLSDINWLTQAPNWSACFTTSAKIVGYTPPKSKTIYTAMESNNEIVQLNGNKIGISVIKQYLKDDKPIVVGVHHTFGNSYNEGTTDHFVVIMGYGIEQNKEYFRFYEVGTTRLSAGTHPQNRFYFNSNGLLVGETQYNKRKYIVTQVRPK